MGVAFSVRSIQAMISVSGCTSTLVVWRIIRGGAVSEVAGCSAAGVPARADATARDDSADRIGSYCRVGNQKAHGMRIIPGAADWFSCRHSAILERLPASPGGGRNRRNSLETMLIVREVSGEGCFCQSSGLSCGRPDGEAGGFPNRIQWHPSSGFRWGAGDRASEGSEISRIQRKEVGDHRRACP